ncbi:hypothetical protein NQ318_015713 [Aromia moschata]|uniref:Mos1 transposase HTH domain-containing protein n=1 Tax=Aromia moschata TaxID=1265417 RepID=A0AAV8XY43_9CUCU|nr:hypothetical protein NQ318_015713 [Aromia moschata]
MLSVQMEQGVNVKSLVKLGKTFTEAYATLKEVYGNEFLSRTQVFEWFKRFKEGRETTEDDPRPGHVSKSKTDENIEKIHKLIREDRCLSIRGHAEMTGIDKECVRQILHESFNMFQKWCHNSSLLSKKESRMNIFADIIDNIDTDPGLLDTMITCGQDSKVWKRLKQKRGSEPEAISFYEEVILSNSTRYSDFDVGGGKCLFKQNKLAFVVDYK